MFSFLQVRETTDRARKAETIVLELRQNMAVQQFSNLLEKAQTSCKQYESDAQRYTQAGRSEDATLLTQYAQVSALKMRQHMTYTFRVLVVSAIPRQATRDANVDQARLLLVHRKCAQWQDYLGANTTERST